MDSQQELQRLDLNSLVQHGRQALRERRYGPAARLLREAAKRAPFRADLRELLGEAMQGATTAEMKRPAAAKPAVAAAAAPAPRAHAVAETAMSSRPPAAARTRDYVDFEPEEPNTVELPAAPPTRPAQPAYTREPEPPPARAAAARPSILVSPTAASTARVFEGVRSRSARGAAATPSAPLARPLARTHGRAGERAPLPRHRSPLAPLFIGMAVAVLFIAVAGGGWIYMSRHRESERLRMERERLTAIVTKANEYKARGEYALALEQLKALPANSQRDAELANFYREKGNANLDRQPPDYANAIQDFSAGLKEQPLDTGLGVNLGQAYYQLAADQRDSDRTAAEHNLGEARKTFEIVLDREPNNINALNFLAKIATLQRDPVLQRQCYLNIMKAAPNTPEAAAAKRNLESLGMRL